jgi:septal ring factor EnvC (AmiA/AmiB activator)
VRRHSALLLVLISATAVAGHHKHVQVAAPPDAQIALTDQLSAESQALAKTLSTVLDKLASADALRLRHLRAAARLLHAPLPEGASADERLSYARRRAAARLLLDRDAAERGLLATEADHLRAADTRLAADTASLAQLHLPTELAWPAHGTIARHFGTFVHEHSKATLSRRGIDIEVEDGAPAVAPADGVVRYAGAIRGLDHGVIVDCGDSLIVVAKLAEPALPVGAHVAKGDRLGHAARHRVYLELRAKVGPGGLPIDPEPYLH